MQPSTCDLCENPVVIHETVLRCGVVKMRRLCRSHGLKLWRDAVAVASDCVSTSTLKKTPTPTSVTPAASLGAPRDR